MPENLDLKSSKTKARNDQRKFFHLENFHLKKTYLSGTNDNVRTTIREDPR